VLAGWLVLVPIVGIAADADRRAEPAAAMGRAALDAQADSSLQHSVLVESIAGIETLKAARAEGQMLGRWRRYSAMSAATQERMRRLTAVAVNLASRVAAGDQRRPADRRLLPFNEGDMTMGAIIAIVMLAGARCRRSASSPSSSPARARR
jgi:ATP-binding cassette subfamily C protein LapB